MLPFPFLCIFSLTSHNEFVQSLHSLCSVPELYSPVSPVGPKPFSTVILLSLHEIQYVQRTQILHLEFKKKNQSDRLSDHWPEEQASRHMG